MMNDAFVTATAGFRVTVVSILVCLALAGCTAAPAPSVAPANGPAEMSSSEVNQAVVDCLIAKGWDPVVGRTSIFYNGPEEQQGAFDDDYWGCRTTLGLDAIKPPEYTPEYLAKKYGQEQETRTCLIGQGEDIPELPSLQAYSDMFFNEGKIYSSYDFLLVNQSASDALRAICGDPLEMWGTDIG